MRRRAVSVGRRLAALVAVEVATAALLLVVAFAAYGRVASDLGFMARLVLAPIEGISTAMENAAQLKLTAERARTAPQTSMDVAVMQGWAHDVDVFLDHYRSHWAAADNMIGDAVRFRMDLERAGRAELLPEERAAMNDVE